MPYNTTAIPPPRAPTGTSQLPLSRVRRIVQVDQDIAQCSNAASFVISIATEMFIQYLSEASHAVVKSERKPRRNIQYRDVSSAIYIRDKLEFLADVVPKTVPYKEVKDKKTPASLNPLNNGAGEGSGSGQGQTTLPFNPLANGGGDGPSTNGNGHTTNGFTATNGRPISSESNGEEGDDSTIADPNEQLKMENLSRGASVRMSVGSNGGILNGVDESEDIEMS